MSLAINKARLRWACRRGMLELDVLFMPFVEEAWDEVKDRGGRLETHVYSDADHAWDKKNSTRWEYNEEVDKDSHKRTIEFFRKHMK